MNKILKTVSFLLYVKLNSYKKSIEFHWKRSIILFMQFEGDVENEKNLCCGYDPWTAF